MEKEYYERTEEEIDELGLREMKTEGYEVKEEVVEEKEKKGHEMATLP